jgi:hypothetical protein
VTAATVPSATAQPLLGKIGAALRARARAKGNPSRIAAALATARAHTATIGALAAADFGGFTVWHHGGWFVLAASILALHFDVAG